MPNTPLTAAPGPFPSKLTPGGDASRLRAVREDWVQYLQQDALDAAGGRTLIDLLPFVFSLRGQPYDIKNHFVFEPFYRLDQPRRTVWKTGRQVAKSTNLAAQGVLQSVVIPYFNTLFVTPLYEMIRRFSGDYVRPFIEQSPVKPLWSDTTTDNSVLQRSFKNHSKMYFSFAFLNADRTRGITASKLAIDEMQDMHWDLIGVLREVLSAQTVHGYEQYTGTPKTLDNTAHNLWVRSSQAEWVIRCGCGKWNVPALEHDLMQMIGPWRYDINEASPGVICANPKCRKPVSPREGAWQHAYPSRRLEFPGYHVPQIIMPTHYAHPHKWATLLGKQQDTLTMTYAQFLNEVCGESCDIGAKLVTQTDLLKAATLHPNVKEEALKHVNEYVMRVLACDWGGGGKDETSYTVYAVLGLLPDGKIDVIYGERSYNPFDHVGEAQIAINLVDQFQCRLLAHDYDGSGSLRETLILQRGFPLNRIVPIAYIGPCRGAPMRHVAATDRHPRNHYQVDKTRALLLVCHQLKTQQLRFFKYDFIDPDRPGLLHDFLALIEEKINSRAGSDVYTIQRNPERTDDFAQAVTYGCCTLWHSGGRGWPRLVESSGLRASARAFEATSPASDRQWMDIP